MPEFENFAMVAAKIAGIKTVPKMCSLEDKLLCACEDSYLPEKYIEQTKQLITTRIAVLRRAETPLHTKWKILLILYVRVCSPSAPLQ